ncbi:MAG: gamma-glutamyltransferase [Ignavibacteriaceae bacterium]|nr:gamma-glutamyltransferase [Ignavibacteriaceae bacterium]
MMLKYSKKVFLISLIISFFAFTIKAASDDPVKAKNGMVVSASELASKVGVQILQKGGNAVDAAVAVGFALAVTYPAAGNIGGGGFMVIHLSDGRDVTIDYREQAPLKAFREMYLNSSGNYLPELSQTGETSSGVPGSVAGLIYALEKYGTMKLSDVIKYAINLAEDGFPLSENLAQSFNWSKKHFDKYESTKKVFTKNNADFAEGEIFKQPDLANTLKQIKEKGRDGFYKGDVAKLIIEQMEKSGGYITFEDLESYQPKERVPVTGTYKDFKIVSMGPPSSGGIALIEMLNILENFNFKKKDWGSSRYIHTLAEAMKYTYADRTFHLGDEDFYPVPKKFLLSKEYANQIAAKITGVAVPSSQITHGNPNQLIESKETTHYSVCDKFGNAVSTTTTINSSFGSKVIVDGAGFFLNNEMDDFSAKPNTPNQFGLLGGEANSIQPGKRMLSSMTPTIVLKDGKPFIVVGSPGGSTIMTVVLQVILNVIDFKMDIKQAIDMPKIHHQWFPDEIDYEPFGLSSDVIANLISMGQNIGTQQSLGRVEGIVIDNSKAIFYGASDPRGDGLAKGY